MKPKFKDVIKNLHKPKRNDYKDVLIKHLDRKDIPQAWSENQLEDWLVKELRRLGVI